MNGPLGACVFSFLSILVLTPSAYSGSNIPSVPWRELSDTKLTETGRQALDVYGDAWQHAETERFVYHFHDAKEAQTIWVHAETIYARVKETLGVRADGENRKSHVFVFDDKELWRTFAARTPEKLPGAEAFTNGFELFLYREPFYLEPQRVLAHEITHLALFRFVEGSVPLFLNEGFAEFMAMQALAPKADGDVFRLRTFSKIPEKDFIPLEEFFALKTYPAGREEVFYKQSELLARFLILSRAPDKFSTLLQLTAKGTSFGEAVKKLYGEDPETFAEKFRLYAETR